MRNLVVGLLLCAAAFGDTLEMKDGRLVDDDESNDFTGEYVIYLDEYS